ncbi:NADAR domain-containing protein [Microdochium nivale]|nr:NADAR domain-containing protein [Microdochium nivale]
MRCRKHLEVMALCNYVKTGASLSANASLRRSYHYTPFKTTTALNTNPSLSILNHTCKQPRQPLQHSYHTTNKRLLSARSTTATMPPKKSNSNAPPITRSHANKGGATPITSTTTEATDKGNLYFWKPENPEVGYLSQWYWLPFYDDREEIDEADKPRKVYKTAEHYMMHHKALLFGEESIAAEILEANDPKTVKALGRTVKGFDDKTWNSNRERIVTRGNYCKFSFPIVDGEAVPEYTTARNDQGEPAQQQVEQKKPREWELGNAEDALKYTAVSFREVLLQTGSKELVEASPYDKIWGVGFGAAKAGVNKGRWGLNLLGKCLMAVREQFHEEAEKRDV